MNLKSVIIVLALLSGIGLANAASISIDWVYPTTDINVSQNEFFNMSVLVNCIEGDCGEINVTLDPSSNIYNFTTCNASGVYGPTENNCTAAYSGTTLEGLVTVSNGIQNWTVPTTGTYTIEAVGAAGGSNDANAAYVGGFGTSMKGDFDLVQGQVIYIVVGQKGGRGGDPRSQDYTGNDYDNAGGGGGGGTFVYFSNYGNNSEYPLIAAGGGGGAESVNTGVNASITTNGTASIAGGTAGAGGTNGTCGTIANWNSGNWHGGSGAGWKTRFTSRKGATHGEGGYSYTGDWKGGAAGGMNAYAVGGFGGGGGASEDNGGAGGGGGYSGGGASQMYANAAGGGGGSYNNGTNQNNTAGFNSGDGYVIITSSGSAKSGTVSTNNTATPFYTTANPMNVTLTQGASATVTWWVNATGSIDVPYEFFAYGNLSSDESISNETARLNITIKDTTAPAISIDYPLNTTYDTNVSAVNYTYSDSNGNGFCQYSLDNGQTFSDPVSSGTNFASLHSTEGSNTLTLYCNDSSGNLQSAEVSFTKKIPVITLSLIQPTGDRNATLNEFFRISVNISCSNNNCGEINLSLDKIGGLTSIVPASVSGSTILIADGAATSGGSDRVDWVNVTDNGNGTAQILVRTYYPSGGYTSTDGVELKLFYNDTTGWIQNISRIYHSSALRVGDGYVNETRSLNVYYTENFTFTATANAGRHYIRAALQDRATSTDRITGWYAGGGSRHYDNADVTFNVTGGGGRSVVSSEGTPFYTNETNPYNVSLNEGEHTVITWWVNATGNINSTTEFIVTANKTDDSTNGKETQRWNVTIINETVDYEAPEVSIDTPADNSGQDENITVIYDVSEEHNITNCSLAINRAVNQTNISIASGRHHMSVRNVPVGRYVITVTCTDNFNNTAEINKTLSIIRKSKFSGNTTLVNETNVENIPNFTIDEPSYGKILFLDNVNLSEGADINSYVAISSNWIEINTSALPSLNRTARLQLYGLAFSTPQILKDGELCPDDICAEEGYSSGVLTFNVTQFSSYSARETPTTTTTTTIGGGSSPQPSGSAYHFECTKNEDCEEDYFCYSHKCVKLFDAEIKEVSPLIDSTGFLLKYLIKGMGNINTDVIIKFWIESDDRRISLGQDTVFMGSFEEKTKETQLNLPSNVVSGAYDLYVQVNYENYSAESFRKINIKLPDSESGLQVDLVETKASSSQNEFFNTFILVALLAAILIILYLIEQNRELISGHVEKRKTYLKEFAEKRNIPTRIQPTYSFDLMSLKKSPQNENARQPKTFMDPVAGTEYEEKDKKAGRN